MVKLAVEYAFSEIGLNEITLGVFDFNQNAIITYRGIGFMEYQFSKGARQFQNEKWNLIKMKLHKNRWLNDGNV
ncbi:MAG: GNAT family N-acetyltransferase [Aestuariibacter sp.]|nr:GNAT family N-acetyltransferase [Aestuariibacter sp.]